MEFAVNRKLLAVSLEAPSADSPHLSLQFRTVQAIHARNCDLHATGRTPSSWASTSRRRRRGSRHHGSQWGRQEHLAKVLAGSDEYEVTKGSELLVKISEMSIEERQRSASSSVQYPVEIPGVSNSYFLKTAINAQRKQRGEEEIAPGAFIKLLKTQMGFLDMDPAFRNRFVNVGFSGGEKSATRSPC